MSYSSRTEDKISSGERVAEIYPSEENVRQSTSFQDMLEEDANRVRWAEGWDGMEENLCTIHLPLSCHCLFKSFSEV